MSLALRSRLPVCGIALGASLFAAPVSSLAQEVIEQRGVYLRPAPLQQPTKQLRNQPQRVRFIEARQNFDHVRQLLLREHVGGTLSEEELFRAATEGMLLSLNQGKRTWNRLLSPGEYRELETGLKGRFAGIGVEVEIVKQTGTAVIKSVLPNSPADQAGLRRGDQVLSINGKRFSGKNSLAEVVKEIRGPVGESLSVKYLRGDQVIEKNITRAVVSWAPVKSNLRNNLGYVGIRYFNRRTPQMMREKLASLKGSQIQGLILDLRKNSGGVFGDAVETADYLLPKGKVITHVVGRDQKVKAVRSVRTPLITMPLVVIVDETTSSGAELVAASLKENLGVQLIGQKTFGKWNAQNIRKLPNQFAIKYTVHEFRSPKNKSYHDVGLTPDVIVANPQIIEGKKSASPTEKDEQLEAAYRLLQKMI